MTPIRHMKEGMLMQQNIRHTLVALTLSLACLSVSARNVIIRNELSNKWLIVQQLYQVGVTAKVDNIKDAAGNIKIPPKSKQSWAIPLPALDNYLYGVKILVADNPDDLSTATPICKSITDKSSAVWTPLDLQYVCDEDETLAEQPNYDPESEPFSVMVTSKSQ